MAHIGETLRTIREAWGLSLREVAERTDILATEWGNSEYAVSHGYLSSIERNGNNLSAIKLISLAEVLSVTPQTLLRCCIPERQISMVPDPLGGPNKTVLLTEGRLAERATALLSDSFGMTPIPERTTLLANRASNERGRYHRAIIGSLDLTLYPLLPPGTIVKIDTFKRSIATRKEWKDEFDRPCYLLYTRKGYICAWCDLEERGKWLRIIPHFRGSIPEYMGPSMYPRLDMDRDVEVVGCAISKVMNLEA